MTLLKNHRNAPHALRRAAPSEPLAGHDMHDYADRFEVPLSAGDDRTAEQVFRAGLERAPLPLRWTVLVVHRHILKFRLGPRSSPTHVLGWRIVTVAPDAIQLEASGPQMRGVLVARRGPAGTASLDTFIYYRRPAARLIWAGVSILHRAVAPYLLQRAAVVKAD
jgi:hypothetical protein